MNRKILNILRISALVMGITGVMGLLAFVGSQPSPVVCQQPVIEIDINEDKDFITQEEVVKMIHEFCTDSSVNFNRAELKAIEERLIMHPAIRSAEVFIPVNGKMHVQIYQREPMGRIINELGEEFYMDTDGRLMPIISGHPARVVIVNGAIRENYTANPYYLQHDSLAQLSMLDDVHQMLQFIHNDAFWKAQIEQIFVTADTHFVLVPKVGNHEIIFGPAEFIKEKFKKLEVFYKNGLTSDGWLQYTSINVQYKNQIVCKRAGEELAPIAMDSTAILAPIQNNVQ